jgi:hypothetical protein
MGPALAVTGGMDRTAPRELAREGMALAQHHDDLEEDLGRLLDFARADDLIALRGAWRAWDGELKAHLEFEETELLPGFGKKFPLEEAELRREHMKIRSALADLEAEIDLGLCGAQSLEALKAMLREHTRREERLFYPQSADRGPGGPSFKDRLAKLAGALSSAA